MQPEPRREGRHRFEVSIAVAVHERQAQDGRPHDDGRPAGRAGEQGPGRAPPGRRGRRRNVVVLTDAGRATLRAATRAGDAAERELLSALDDDEAAHLRALLARVSGGTRR